MANGLNAILGFENSRHVLVKRGFRQYMIAVGMSVFYQYCSWLLWVLLLF
jgi:hypothetical protein